MILISKIDSVKSLNQLEFSINDKENPNIVVKSYKKHIILALRSLKILQRRGYDNNLFLRGCAAFKVLSALWKYVIDLDYVFWYRKTLEACFGMQTNLKQRRLVQELMVLTQSNEIKVMFLWPSFYTLGLIDYVRW